MMTQLKRLFGYPRVKPVTMRSVKTPPEPNPELVLQSKATTAQLTGELMAVERKAHEVRETLAHNTLRLLVRYDRGK